LSSVAVEPFGIHYDGGAMVVGSRNGG
jgi:hypothetical protein